MAPESANNAADQTSFIPTLALGIPGSATMALMLGVLIIHGIQPGPTLMDREPELFWGLVMSFWIGNVLLLILNIPLVGLWARLLLVPYYILYPAVLVFICIGTLSVQQNVFHVWTVAFFGLLGYLMRVLGFSAAPLLLGFVLGPMMEEHFRRAMLISAGGFRLVLRSPDLGGRHVADGTVAAPRDVSDGARQDEAEGQRGGMSGPARWIRRRPTGPDRSSEARRS